MIKASQVLALLEGWVAVGPTTDFKVEVLEDPSSWQEATSDLSYEWKNLRKKGLMGADFPRLLRFAYSPRSGEIKAWIAFWATHHNILGSAERDWWCGEVNVDKKIADISSGNTFYTDSGELPPKLQKFLNRLHLVDYTLC
jgi:hypothetical protein